VKKDSEEASGEIFVIFTPAKFHTTKKSSKSCDFKIYEL